MSEPLLDQIREAKPAASPELRSRIRALGAEAPSARRSRLASLHLRPGRALALAGSAAVVAALGAGLVKGLTSEPQSHLGATGAGQGTTGLDQSVSSPTGAPESATKEPLAPTGNLGAPATADALAPTPGRLQRFQAEMRLRVADVEELSGATKRAMQIAQSLRGYVVSVQYDAPAQGVGGAQIVLRVPTARVQTALTQLSALGTILGQSRDALRRAGSAFGPPGMGDAGPAQAFARRSATASEMPAPAASPGTAGEEPDEIDRLFRGG